MQAHRGKALIGPMLAAALVSIAGLAHANDWPVLRYGMWNYTRIIESAGGARSIASKKCSSPVEDLKKQHDGSAKAGCTISSVTRSANSYTFMATCTLQGQTVQSKSVMTVESDSAYKITVESQAGGQGTTERLVANRTGDC